MPLFADATALVALGRISALDLLRSYDPEVVISTWVRRRELRRFASQVDRAVEDGWIREQEPSVTLVELFQAQAEINRGEAEVIVLAGGAPRGQARLLLDEGPAFAYLADQRTKRRLPFELVCLADVLHRAETVGRITSAATTMQDLLDGDHYRWAEPVWREYEETCRRRGIDPLPRRPSARQ